MKSPLAMQSDLIKEFNITKSAELDPVMKISYVRSQIDEFKKVMFRNLVDATISQDLIERSSKDGNEAMESKGRDNLTNYRNVIKQMAAAIEVMETLLGEIEVTTPAE